MLSMAFFGSVLIVATLLLTQTLNIYNRGMVTKQMNQVGRTLVEDMIRVGNSGRDITTAVRDGKATCIAIDDTVYLWNLADPNPDNTEGYTVVYRYTDTTPVNFVKLTNQDGKDCKNIGTTIDKNQASSVVGDTVRVYDMTVNKIPGTNLVRVAMLLGTFDTVGSSYNLVNNAGNFECRPDGVGNFCAKANFDTVLYVPNGGFGK